MLEILFMCNIAKVWWGECKNAIALLFSILSVGLAFITWEDIGVDNICCKIIILVVFFGVSIGWATAKMHWKKENVIWSRGAGKIVVRYGDLLKIGFFEGCCKGRKERIVVIPVNTNFDMIVESAMMPNPLVSDQTIHGKWIRMMGSEYGDSVEKLEKDIFSYLDERNVKYVEVEREKGSKRRYDKGTCAVINRGKTYFFLLALSEFNERNNAYCAKNELIEVTRTLTEVINQQGQGYECYVPLMGTGLSRVGLDHKTVLHYIVSTMELYCDEINSELNIVIYDGDRDKVKIFDA